MSLREFREHQQAAEYYAKSPVFPALVPLVLQMYECPRNLAQPVGSAGMGRLLLLCHREFLVAATLIQRGLAYETAANTRRTIEIAKLALALKRDPANAEKWMKAAERQARWKARKAGRKPESLQSPYFPGVQDDPLYKELHQYFGMYSDRSFISRRSLSGCSISPNPPMWVESFVIRSNTWLPSQSSCGTESRSAVFTERS